MDDRADAGRLPAVRGHRSDTGLRIVSLKTADRHESAEAVEYVLIEVALGNVRLDPLHRAVVEVGIFALRIVLVVAFDLRDSNHRLALARHDDPIALLHLVCERV